MNYRSSSLAAILSLMILAGCTVEQQINRNYVASLKLLNQLQPVHDVKPAKRECDTCHKLFDMRSQYKPQRYYPLKISHRQHAQLGIDCAFCHRTAAGSTEATDYLMPGGHADAVDPEAYSLQPQAADANPCKACHIHYAEMEKNDPKMPARCDTCHIYYQPGKPLPYVEIGRKGLKNNHKAHADNGISCLRCHVGFDLLDKPTAMFVPKMDLCMECHDLPSDTMRARKEPVKGENDHWFRRAEQLYGINCSPCHGKIGRGDGSMVAFFKADLKPRDHTDSTYMEKKTDEQIFSAIWKGGAEVNRSVRMPAFEGLMDEKDAHLLVRYIRWLSQSTGATSPPA